MSIKRHRTLAGEDLALDRLPSSLEAHVRWLACEALRATSWAAFQERTARATIEAAREVGGEGWAHHAIYRLQKDLVGQVGAVLGELRGETTSSFGALLLSGMIQLESSPQVLFASIAAAQEEGVVVEESELHRFVFEHKRLCLDSFDYVFTVDPSLVFSRDLESDYQSLKDRGELAVSSPIRVTEQGRLRAQMIHQRYKILRSALRPLYRNAIRRAPSLEDLFTHSQVEAFKAAL